MMQWLSWRSWLVLSLTSILLFGVGWWYQWEVDLLSPINEQATFRFLPAGESNGLSDADRIIYGFLPYWNMAEVTIQPELTHLAYFGLDIMADGTIRTRMADTTAEPGYHRLGNDRWFSLYESHINATPPLTAAQSKETTPTKKVDLVFTQFNNDAIASFVTTPAAHTTFLSSLDTLLLAYPITGINIDIEYSGKVTPALRDGMTAFMKTVHEHLRQKYQAIELSIDVYAGASSNQMIWDIPAIEPYTDYFIVMAYDFHRRQSTVAGPVAPLFGGKEYWDSDISYHLKGFLNHVPGEKIILGVPFYGYEWQTTSREPQSHTFPNTGATATYKRVQDLLTQTQALQVQEHWDEVALAPYISYTKDGAIYVVYYEDSRSLSYKLDFVNQLDLAGIAIWALGYEGNSRELWEVVERKM